ncbi:RNA polymerase RpoE-like sigma-24 subunit [Tumebacillus sp. BK434]|uniref:RNA polymerase sigma factor n=1 Tax=Tumebacillus sp. BK434 TaxID=2512169 RepID=UPI0010449B96|nr:RNA polymerase sigma factor [Tumebacillus sp. BK434]TCP53897.1 RNA polymerase RpoE-like sigma-24 subunit [Tumebacillus sp. BK434]
MQGGSDQELIQRVTAGDSNSYRLLVERYQTLVYTIAHRMVRDRTEAEDLTQEIFLKAYRMLDSFREEASFKTWICKIATNRCIDWRRKHVPRQEQTAQVEEAERIPDDLDASPEHVLLRREQQEEVHGMLEEMPEKYRSILLMYHFQGMSYKDIAEAQEISPRTVETRLYRAKNMLRERLKGGGSDGARIRRLDLEVSKR